MKTQSVTMTTSKDVATVGRALQEALAHAKARSIDDIQSTAGALSRFDDRADIEIVAQGQGLVGGSWAVQIYVLDQGEDRLIELVALGDGGFSRAMNGARNSTSLSASIKKRDQIAQALR